MTDRGDGPPRRRGAAAVPAVLALVVAAVFAAAAVTGARTGREWAEDETVRVAAPPGSWVAPTTTTVPPPAVPPVLPFTPDPARPSEAPYSRYFAGVLRLRAVTPGGLSIGTAFVVGDGTWAVTNRHVVAGAERIEAETWDGRAAGGARVAASGEGDVDLAVLRLDRALEGAFEVSAEPPPVGATVSVGGFPEARRFLTAGGRLVAVTRDGGTELLVTTVPAAPGSSGSPLLDDDGAVVGVVFAGSAGGFTLALPASQVAGLVAVATAPTPG